MQLNSEINCDFKLVMKTTRSNFIQSFAMLIVFVSLLVLTNGIPISNNSNKETSPERSLDDSFEHWTNGKSSLKASSWTKWYANSDGWANLTGSSCGGKQQSPIDIQPRLSVMKAFPKFTFHNYGNVDKMILMNNGHTAMYYLQRSFPQNRIPYITGGGLNGTYEFAQFHLHWGNDSTKGSEHLIRSKSYPGELHLVHFNTKYGSFANATAHSDGLAVLGILLKTGVVDNEYFRPLVDQLSDVSEDHDETILTSIISFKDLLPKQTASFYRYSGSLTTPFCQQIVIWTIFDNPVEISERQIKKFRELENDEGQHLVNNFRPSQKMNGRTIFYRSRSGCEIPQSLSTTSFSFAVQLIALLGCF